MLYVTPIVPSQPVLKLSLKPDVGIVTPKPTLTSTGLSWANAGVATTRMTKQADSNFRIEHTPQSERWPGQSAAVGFLLSIKGANMRDFWSVRVGSSGWIRTG